jgi:hypothetical protein
MIERACGNAADSPHSETVAVPQDRIICGAGVACEAICPVMQMGRSCPGLSRLMEELEALSHPWLAPTASLVR